MIRFLQLKRSHFLFPNKLRFFTTQAIPQKANPPQSFPFFSKVQSDFSSANEHTPFPQDRPKLCEPLQCYGPTTG
jgi:hypothetical protein